MDNLKREAFAEAETAGMNARTFSAFLRPLQALEAHDADTWAHCLRVGLSACRFARSGPSAFAPVTALRCGIAHDVGKLDIPVEVLTAEPFRPEHYAVVAGHALAGFRRLAGLDPEAALVAGLHHAFQASPYGLKPAGIAPTILALTKIVAVCDFADALVYRHDSRHTKAERLPETAKVILAKAFPDQAACVAWLTNNVLVA